MCGGVYVPSQTRWASPISYFATTPKTTSYRQHLLQHTLYFVCLPSNLPLQISETRSLAHMKCECWVSFCSMSLWTSTRWRNTCSLKKSPRFLSTKGIHRFLNRLAVYMGNRSLHLVLLYNSSRMITPAKAIMTDEDYNEIFKLDYTDFYMVSWLSSSTWSPEVWTVRFSSLLASVLWHWLLS